MTGLGTTAAVPGAPHGIHFASPAATSVARNAAFTSSPIVVPGNNPAGQPFVNAPSLIAAENHREAGRAINWTAVSAGSSSFLQTPEGAPPVSSSATPSSAQSLPPPGVTYATGLATGYVELSTTHAAMQGVGVQAYSALGTSNCPISVCPQAFSSTNGSFTVKGPVGNDYLAFTYTDNLTNYTYVSIQLGQTSNVGTVYMVPEGWVVGTVEANISTHKAIAGVTVTAVSRDNSLTGIPTGFSSSSGYFRASAPPVPSIVTFSPPYGYLPTFMFINTTPGQVVNLGVVFLQKEPVVTAKLYDAVSKSVIPTGECDGFVQTQCNAITVCSSVTNQCLKQGPDSASATTYAVGPAGYDYVQVWSTGYVVDNVPIGFVPYSSSVYNAGNIYLTPLGGVAISSSITYNRSTTLPNWGTGLWTAQICSMNGLYTGAAVPNPATFTVNNTETQCSGGCGPVSSFVQLGALPLRNDIKLKPDTVGACAPTPQWPIPGLDPVYGNETWVNVTPDELTSTYLNMSIGDYLFGNVSITGSPLANAPSDFTATTIPQDDPALDAYSFVKSVDGNPTACRSLKQSVNSFCIAVPPGASKLQIQTTLTAYSANFTWGSAPRMCCNGPYPISLDRWTSDSETSVNLTGMGQISGKIVSSETGVPVFFASFQIGAAGTQPSQPSFDGAVSQNSTFYSPAPLGWDYITASASGFSPNTEWVYVQGNESIGSIPLTPLAILTGQVVDQTGHGIVEANVYYCLVDQTTTCSKPLGAGITTTAGSYNGTVTGGWLPWSTYEIEATAAGYSTDWAWVNATAGQSATVPTLTLFPSGQNASPTAPRAGSHAPAASSLSQVYVDGYLIDNSTGQGFQTGSVSACASDGTGCVTLSPGSNSQGYFNSTVPSGLYYLTVSAIGYKPLSYFFNASGRAYVHLEALQVFPYPWVQGTVNITPFGQLSIETHPGSYVQIPFAPAAAALGCTANGSLCGASLPIASNGSFFVQTPGGPYNLVRINPTGGATGPSTGGGFVNNQSTYNSTTNVTTLTHAVSLPIDVMIGGIVYDNSTFGPFGVSPWLPVEGASVTVATFGPAHTTIAYTANTGGMYLDYVPPGPNNTIAAATLGGVYVPSQASMTTSLVETDPPVVYQAPTLQLQHFGWVQAHVLDSANGTPAQYVSVDSSYYSSALQTSLDAHDQTNGAGLVNLSAAPGHPVLITVGPYSDFNSTNTTVWVNGSATTYAAGGSSIHIGTLLAAHYGWLRSTSVNNSTTPDLVTILDNAKQLPLPGASVLVASSDSTYSGTSVQSNYNGQFITDAPIGPDDSVTITHGAYLANATKISVTANETVVSREINLTGVGVLSGTIISYPSLQPVPFAAVQTCPYSVNATFNTAGCYTTTANASGFYWVAAFPGLVTITTSAQGFVSNSSTVARACSDCWNALGPITLNAFSFISGQIRGLPSGLPVDGATVSACSPLGNPVGVCNFDVVTSSTGHFTLETPSGQYVLKVNATEYNTSYLPVSLLPGEVLPVGTIFLQQFGIVRGAVISAQTLLPVEGASVFACASWAGGQCTPTTQTAADGTFTITGAPGGYTIAVQAAGYADAYGAATVKAGVTTILAPIQLSTLGVDVSYEISGRVVNASEPSQGILGATVAAEVNGTDGGSQITGTTGAFGFDVLYGTYELVVSAPGYAPSSQQLIVHGAITGLAISLSTMLYPVSGTVTDGLTNLPLSGVGIAEDGAVLGVSDANGLYAFELDNGTHSLSATYEGGSSIAYGTVTFSLSVNGIGLVRNLALYPPSVTVKGFVVDSVSGIPLHGASVSLRGQTADGVPVSQTLTSDPAGGFTATVPVGSYNVSASLAGYTSNVVSFAANPPGAGVTILMTPTTPTSQPASTVAPSGPSALILLAGILAVVIIGAVLTGLIVLRYRAAPTPSRRTATAPRKPDQGGKP